MIAALAGSVALNVLAGAAVETPQIPLAPGVVATFAVVGPTGDEEPSFTIRSVTTDYYDAAYSCEIDDPRTHRRRTVVVARRVSMQDHREAHAIRSEYWEGDPLTYPGTTPFLSSAIIQDLRRGSTTFTDHGTTSLFGIPMPSKRRVTLKRIGFEKLPFLVNGRMTELRVIHARGETREEATGKSGSLDMLALDDLQSPIYLRWRESNRGSQLVRIDYPDAAAAQARLEAALMERKHHDVYNVYFAFASAALRPESSAALDDIAAVLARHPEWKLRIEGHTDNIGGNTSNLDLSARRAEAVRDALVRRYRIASHRLSAGGNGAGGAVATNDTPEGRARNRRVVLSRE